MWIDMKTLLRHPQKQTEFNQNLLKEIETSHPPNQIATTNPMMNPLNLYQERYHDWLWFRIYENTLGNVKDRGSSQYKLRFSDNEFDTFQSKRTELGQIGPWRTKTEPVWSIRPLSTEIDPNTIRFAHSGFKLVKRNLCWSLRVLIERYEIVLVS